MQWRVSLADCLHGALGFGIFTPSSKPVGVRRVTSFVWFYRIRPLSRSDDLRLLTLGAMLMDGCANEHPAGYVQMSAFFFILAPPLQHMETGRLLSYSSWKACRCSMWGCCITAHKTHTSEHVNACMLADVSGPSISQRHCSTLTTARRYSSQFYFSKLAFARTIVALRTLNTSCH